VRVADISDGPLCKLNANLKKIECVRSCDQKLYLHNETKGGICIKIEFNLQKNTSLLQHGRRFFIYSSNMAAVTSCEHSMLGSGRLNCAASLRAGQGALFPAGEFYLYAQKEN